MFTTVRYAHAMNSQTTRGSMSHDPDLDLSPDQWETLKALRGPIVRLNKVNKFVCDELARLGLVSVTEGGPSLTRNGRRVLVRGSCRLLDLAA
jgi:hypothetical protein